MAMARSGGRRGPLPARAPASPQSATTPRSVSRRRRRPRVQSPCLAAAAARRGAAPPPQPPPATPPLRWSLAAGEGVPARAGAAASVRRLAAAMWWVQPLPPLESGGVDGAARRRFQPSPNHLHTPDCCRYYKEAVQGRIRNKPVMDGIFHEEEASSASPRIEMEMATKWDQRCVKISRGDDHDLLGHKPMAADAEITALQEELMLARNRIHEVEAESRSAKKKLDHLVRNLAEEKASWRSREHDKIRNILETVKEELNRERKNRQRAEIMNSKLVSELSELKLSAKRYLQDYEKERKARELMEEVCDELAKEIAEDKAEVEALKTDSMKMRDEVEEERKMLQMAEVWREERVQMKLVDAKLTLEYKYSQLSKLQADLEAFLSSQAGSNFDEQTAREAQRLREAISSMKIHDVKEFYYKPPPPSEDIFAVFEELKQREDINEKEIGQCTGYSSSPATKIHTVSPETDMFLEKPANKYPNQPCSRNEDMEDDSGWETVSHVEEQGSSNSPEGSEPSVNGFCEGHDASVSGTDWDDNGENGKSPSETSEVCSTTAEKHRKRGSFVRLWRSSNGDDHKKIGAELLNGTLSNGRMSNVTLSPDPKNGEVCAISPSVGQWSPDLLNPHIARATRGCIEWPRGTQKHNLKAKLLEARIDGSKVQLRQALKQKI